MITPTFKLTGDTTWIKAMTRRLGSAQMEQNVMAPWRRQVMEHILDQYRRRGAVPGERDEWAPNAQATIEQKGHDKPLLSARQYRFGAMVRSYRVETRRNGLYAWTLTLTNTARSHTGFDYPTALHEGRSPKGKFKGYPPRPHLLFQERSIKDLLERAPRWVMEAKAVA